MCVCIFQKLFRLSKRGQPRFGRINAVILYPLLFGIEYSCKNIISQKCIIYLITTVYYHFIKLLPVACALRIPARRFGFMVTRIVSRNGSGSDLYSVLAAKKHPALIGVTR